MPRNTGRPISIVVSMTLPNPNAHTTVNSLRGATGGNSPTAIRGLRICLLGKSSVIFTGRFAGKSSSFAGLASSATIKTNRTAKNCGFLGISGNTAGTLIVTGPRNTLIRGGPISSIDGRLLGTGVGRIVCTNSGRLAAINTRSCNISPRRSGHAIGGTRLALTTDVGHFRIAKAGFVGIA